MDVARTLDRRIDRRRFLRSVGALAGAATIGRGLGAWPAEAAGFGAGAWQDLARRLKGPVLRPGAPGFAMAARPNNLRYANILPAGIARCRDSEDVRQAILWAGRNGVPIVARSGGHSYAGYSTTPGLMIDVSPINGVAVDGSTGVVRVGGGARNGHFYAALKRAGSAITHGRCPTVGAAGFLLGGGIGFTMRAAGLACDQLIATEMVTASGELLAIDARENPDLFWACRGAGGGNLGINTSFTLQSFPAEALTVFKIRWTAKTEAVAPALLAALGAGPDTLGCRVSLAVRPRRERGVSEDVEISLLGQLKGTPADVADLLAPATRIAPPKSETVRHLSYWEGQALLAEPGPPEFYQERSCYCAGPLPEALLSTAFDWLRRWPGPEGSADLRFFQVGGKIKAVAPDATAYVHRGYDWLAVIGLSWDTADDPALQQNRDWQDGFYAAILPFAKGGAYQNFVDPSLADWSTAYYGDNLPRLRAIKAKVDPDFVFRFAQAIPPAAT